MAKAPKPQKGPKPPSIHSRAARRATSPSINTDKSLKNAAPPEDSKSFLAVQNNSGVKKKKGKQQSRAQRLRQEKGQQRAEAVYDQLEKKLGTSKLHARTIQERSLDWENLNVKIGEKRKTKTARDSTNEEADDSSDMEDLAQARGQTNTTGLEQSTFAVHEPVEKMEEQEEEKEDIVL